MKIYSAPAEIPVPVFSPAQDWKEYNKAEDAYVEAVKAWAKKNGKGKYAGEIINFPVADGHASYVVFTNTSLIHLKIGDAWHFQYVKYLTSKAIAERIEGEKKFKSLFDKAR